MKMEKHEMSEILHDVRKAYNLIASYQQRIVELLDFIKNELRAPSKIAGTLAANSFWIKAEKTECVQPTSGGWSK